MKLTEEYLLASKRKSGHEIAPKQLRKTIVQVCLNDGELEYLDTIRAVVKRSRSEFFRLAILENLPMQNPPINTLAWQELSRVASNLNQLVRKTPNNTHAEIEECKAILKQLRAKLLGAF